MITFDEIIDILVDIHSHEYVPNTMPLVIKNSLGVTNECDVCLELPNHPFHKKVKSVIHNPSVSQRNHSADCHVQKADDSDGMYFVLTSSEGHYHCQYCHCTCRINDDCGHSFGCPGC